MRFSRHEMQFKVKYLLLIIFLICALHVSGRDELKRGLFFQSFEVDKDKRTCLNLTPDKPLTFKKGFSMEFDVNFRQYNQNFGYIFRIIGNDTLNIDFLANIASEFANFSLVVKNKAIIQYKKTEIRNTVENIWLKVIFEFDPANNTISLSLGGIKKEEICLFEGIDRFDIYFGGNTHGKFSSTDIAPMIVRDIRIFDAKPELVRYWKLESHAHDAVYDECRHAKAVVSNPQWEIDNHIHWSEQTSFVLPALYYNIAFDPVGDRIFLAKDKNIFICNIKNRTIDTIEARHGIPFYTENNQLEYNPVKNELISYQFHSDHLATFNFHTLEWNNEIDTLVSPRYSHHSSCYIAADSLLITFGGYGFHRYNSILHKYNPVAGVWENFDLSEKIAPRYLGSMGYLGNSELLYFGGFGNESGWQEEFPRNYYDLYSIGVDDISVKKIWELPEPQEPFTNSNSLVIDKSNRKFYSLAYPNKRYASVIQLHEYNLDKPEYGIVGNSIPYNFNDVESYCDLYQSSDSSELYALTSHAKDDATEIFIYSIAFPPLSAEKIIQHAPSHSKIWIWLLLSAFIIAGSTTIFLIGRKRRRKPIVDSHIPIEQIPGNDGEPIIYDSLVEEKRNSSVSLLGNFRIIDSNGLDITKNFTPTTTQLFLLLLMSTIKNGKGITSQELRKILWFDKNDDSARNNRNVYINKLRSILKSFDGIKVANHEGYWTIQSAKNVFCDYERAMVLIKMLQANDRFNIKLLAELTDIAVKGTLLPYMQQLEWLEPYQSDYTTQLIECLMEYSTRDEVKADLLLLLKIADVILLHDNIDEDAIRLKCYALFRSGRKNQALQVFNKFTADYENLLSTKHNLLFDDLVM